MTCPEKANNTHTHTKKENTLSLKCTASHKGTLSKPQRQWRRCHSKIEDLMGGITAQYMHVETLYISKPSSAKQQCEITTTSVV